MDPTIPAHPRGAPTSVTYGQFVDYGDTVKLRDRSGNSWSLEYVTILQGAWGYGDDGVGKLPRPFKYLAGQEVIQGDVVLIVFADNSTSRPVVWGCARNPTNLDFLPYDYESEGADPNVWKAQLLSRDKTSGAELGRVRATANESIGVVDVNRGNLVASEFVLRGETFVADLLGALPELIACCTALGLPTTNLLTLLASLTASSTAKTPYVSTSVKVE